MRILGLDYGSKRIGVAVCDELGIMAHAVTTITRKNKESDLEAIANQIKFYSVEKIVVGYPVKLNGTEGRQCEKVNRFIQHLERRFALPVIRWDETLTTKDAEEILVHAGTRRNKRRKVIDRIAAAIILQSYLDAVKPEKTPENNIFHKLYVEKNKST
jgi:putative Holliday junction resolvase